MIVIICGPAGAGKTTVANLLRKRLEEIGLPFRMLDSDQFGRNPYEQMYEQVERSGGNWLLAGTFYKRTWQERFRTLPDVVVVYLEAELETCLERNRRRSDPIDEAAIHIIWHEFDEPDADVTIDVNERSPNEVVNRLTAALEPVGRLISPSTVPGRMALQVDTTERIDVVDVTSDVASALPAEVDRGVCTVFVPHTTAGVVVNERETRLLSDLEEALERLVPREEAYAHNAIDDNADAHLRAMLLGASVSIPVVDGDLALGTWQSILLVECDGPRTRSLEVTVTSA